MQDINNSKSAVAPDAYSDAATVKLIDYFEIVVKHQKMTVRLTLAAFVIALISSLLMSDMYNSTAMIIPPPQDGGLMGLMMNQVGGGGIASLAGDIMGKGSSADFYASIVKCEDVEDKVIDHFNLMKVYDQQKRNNLYKIIDHIVTVEVGKKDGIISISVLDKDPKRAADMANFFVDELGKLAAGLGVTGAAQDRAFAESRLAKAKMDLVRAEDAIKGFQTQSKAIDIVEQAKGTIKGIGDLEGQLASEEVKLAGLLRIFTEASQEVKNERLVIANLKAHIGKFEGSHSESAVPGIASVPALGENYVRLTREFKTQEMLVELLTKQLEISKFTEAKNLPTIQVIQRAKVPDKKAKPQRMVIVLMTTFLALIGSLVLSFLLEQFESLPASERKRWQNLKKTGGQS